MRRIITTLLTTILSITAAVCFLLVGIEDTGLTPSQTLLVGAAALALGALAVLVHDDAHDADRAGRGEPMASPFTFVLGASRTRPPGVL